MSINLTLSSKKFIQDNKITHLLLDVDIIEEGCTAIYSPNLIPISKDKFNKFSSLKTIKSENFKLHLSENFISIFGVQNEYSLDLKGFFEKVLTITNIETKIKDICKV